MQNTPQLYSIAEHLVKSGCHIPAAIMAVASIDETLESVDTPKLIEAMKKHLPEIKAIRADNGYKEILQDVYMDIFPIKGVGVAGAEAVVKLFTPNEKEKPDYGLW